MSTMRPRGLSISCAQLGVGRADREAEAAVHAGLHGVSHRLAERPVLLWLDGVEH